MGYVPGHVTQLDGSECQWSNCWAAVGAWLCKGATRNDVDLTPPQFRKKAQVPECLPAGLGNIERGMRRAGAWGRNCRSLIDVPKADVRKRLLTRSGRLVALETDFEDWPRPTAGDFYHMIGVVCGEGTKENRGKVRVMDPLENRIKWVGIDAVMQAANRYNNQHGEERGTLDLIVVTPPPWRPDR